MCEIALAEDLDDPLPRLHRQRRRRRGERTCSPTSSVALGLSDAGAHVDQLCDAPLPTDLLGTWVRERGVMPLEHAVRKLTGEPADMFGFVRRGYLREGDWADVCVFDPETVGTGPDCGGCATSRPTASASPPRSRPACATCSSTARPIRVDECAARRSPTCVRGRDPRWHDPVTRRGSAHGAEEGPEILDEQFGLLHGREVPSARHDRPVRDVVALLDPRTREAQHLFLGVARHTGRNGRRTPVDPSALRCAWSPSRAGPTT